MVYRASIDTIVRGVPSTITPSVVVDADPESYGYNYTVNIVGNFPNSQDPYDGNWRVEVDIIYDDTGTGSQWGDFYAHISADGFIPVTATVSTEDITMYPLNEVNLTGEIKGVPENVTPVLTCSTNNPNQYPYNFDYTVEFQNNVWVANVHITQLPVEQGSVWGAFYLTFSADDYLPLTLSSVESLSSFDITMQKVQHVVVDIKELQDYYANLLIIQYHNKEKAVATIKQWVNCMVADGLLLGLQFAFSPDSAVGEQLDMLGKFLGLARNGFNDDDYRILLNFKIITNNCGVSMKEIDDVMYDFFGKSVVCHNNQDMSLTYIVFPEYEHLIPIFQSEKLLPAPTGVGTNAIISVALPDLIFGFKRGNIITEAVGFSTKNGLTEGKFLDKTNIVILGS